VPNQLTMAAGLNHMFILCAVRRTWCIYLFACIQPLKKVLAFSAYIIGWMDKALDLFRLICVVSTLTKVLLALYHSLHYLIEG
jgi:hypothetical protein